MSVTSKSGKFVIDKNTTLHDKPRGTFEGDGAIVLESRDLTKLFCSGFVLSHYCGNTWQLSYGCCPVVGKVPGPGAGLALSNWIPK